MVVGTWRFGQIMSNTSAPQYDVSVTDELSKKGIPGTNIGKILQSANTSPLVHLIHTGQRGIKDILKRMDMGKPTPDMQFEYVGEEVLFTTVRSGLDWDIKLTILQHAFGEGNPSSLAQEIHDRHIRSLVVSYLLTELISRGSSGTGECEWKEGVNLIRKLSGLEEKRVWQGIDSLWRELVEAGVRFDHDAKAFSQVGTTGLVLWKTLLDTERFPSENVLYESYGTKTYLSHTKFTSGKLYFEVKILHSTPSSSEKIKKGDPWMHVGWAKSAYEVLKQPQKSRRELSKGRFVICGSKNAKYWQGKKEAYGDQLDWKKGDVVGCVADLDGGEIRFLMNDKDLGVAFGSEELTRSVLDAGLRITCSFGPGQGAEVNLGNRTFVNTMPVGFRSVFSAVVREEVSKSDDYSDSKSFTMPWFEYKGGEFRLIRYAYRISYDGGMLRTLIASIDFNAQFQTQSQDSCEWTNVGLCALDQVLKSSNSESAHTLEFAKILIHKMNLNQILHGAQEPLWVEIVRRLDSILEIDTEESLDFVLSIVGAHQQDILSDFQKSVIEKLLINVIRMEMSGRNFGLLRKSVGFIRKSMGISGSPSWKGLAFFVQELIDAGMDINRQAWKEIGVPFCVVMASELLQATPLSDANSITNKELEILKIQSVNKVQSGKVYFEVTLIGPAPDSSVRARRNTPWMHLGWSGESFRSVPTNALGADVHRRRRMSKGSYVVCGSKAKRYWKGQKED
eukprot:Tamp_04131.p1 GENE.Tamp_04131~~Tamp_04131.p1  ORF type:complete len:734 (+),score=71.27 Tamp_04131:1213-3414(+)